MLFRACQWETKAWHGRSWGRDFLGTSNAQQSPGEEEARLISFDFPEASTFPVYTNGRILVSHGGRNECRVPRPAI